MECVCQYRFPVFEDRKEYRNYNLGEDTVILKLSEAPLRKYALKKSSLQVERLSSQDFCPFCHFQVHPNGRSDTRMIFCPLQPSAWVENAPFPCLWQRKLGRHFAKKKIFTIPDTIGVLQVIIHRRWYFTFNYEGYWSNLSFQISLSVRAIVYLAKWAVHSILTLHLISDYV